MKLIIFKKKTHDRLPEINIDDTVLVADSERILPKLVNNFITRCYTNEF